MNLLCKNHLCIFIVNQMNYSNTEAILKAVQTPITCAQL